VNDLDLSIVIVNWNSVDYLRRCLGTIRAQTSGLVYEVIVVDNASYDGCGEMMTAEYSEMRFVQSESNLGFSRANNLGARLSSGAILCFLNPDTEVEKHALVMMLHEMRRLTQPGAVGCRLLNSDRTIQTSCIQSFPTIVNQVLSAEALRSVCPRSALWGMAPLFGPGTSAQQVEVVSGACLMMERSVFEAVGGFSEDYFMYAEDVDLCYRASASGRRNYFLPTASIVHHGGGSSSQRTERVFPSIQMRRSIARFFRTHHGDRSEWLYRNTTRWSAWVRIGLLRAMGRRHSASMEKWQGILQWARTGD